MSVLNAGDLRAAFGQFMTGVTVVTARDRAGQPVGFTANSFSSVSLDPPLLLVCPARSLSSFPVFESCTHFSVNILAEGQEDIANRFAGFGGDRFALTAWRSGIHDLPVIEGVAAQFSCQVFQSIPAGDHIILVGEILHIAASGRRGLGYANGRYFSLGMEREAASAPAPGRRTVAGALIEHQGALLLNEGMPPSFDVADASNIRAALAQHLAEAGLAVELGRVYSIFDDRRTAEHFTYFEAQAMSNATGGLGDFTPIGTLRDLDSGGPHGKMLARYQTESETGRFALYVGDEASGHIHPFDHES